MVRLRAWARATVSRVWAPVAGTSGGRFAADILLAARTVARGFMGENLRLRAAALTYISMFSLVPLLTVGLVLLRTLHQEQFQRKLRFVISEVLAPGVSEESAALLDRFLHPGSSIAVGSVGFLAVLLSAGSLLRHIDGAVNELWGIRRQRPWLTRLSIYAGLLLLGPIFLAISFSGTGRVRVLLQMYAPTAPLFIALGTMLIAIGSLTLLYLWTPFAHVRVRSALAGGLVAGVGWMLAKQVYAEFAARSFLYNPLYASLGALPLFLAWVYVSWLVMLFGARLSYAVEHVSFRDSLFAFGTHPRAYELVAARVAQDVTLCWVDGRTPPLPRELATHLRVPESLVHEVVDRLVEARLLERGRRGGLRPARDPAELTLADTTLAVHGVMISGGPETWTGPRAPGFEQFEPLFQAADCAGVDLLRRTRWMDLVTPLRPGLLDPPAPEAPKAAAGSGNP
ncbi:YihY family inner membrane protein [Corallococcus sp. ZKHCc1 1396]|uniref:YihY family inner membrane protein n=1 Tax=Corallococcus soli TaxID=2710757 RepID=A0ABR9PPX3_9BACT|nr:MULTISPECIES: YhjD/YihY/BrkB family envelope integrity protein [Corallococcus]MBE4749970.1 YihY family inner membrane protein [Corallococcus soli]MCY1035754.1 YihY family inner membrane protein [Corallococcus sp. BB11-1]